VLYVLPVFVLNNFKLGRPLSEVSNHIATWAANPLRIGIIPKDGLLY
jgi:hypothetical protein